MTPLKTTSKDTLEDIQYHDGLYGVMLTALRHAEQVVKDQGRNKSREDITLLAYRCLLSASEEFVSQG